MKGTPDAPACGFSARTVAALQALDAPFAAVDILPDPRIRQELSALSQLADDPAALRRAASWSAAATSSSRCSSPASWPRRSASSSPTDAAAPEAAGRRRRRRRWASRTA